MEHIEMVEKLREKAGITSEEAANALSRANWDMLEALVILEREGKIPPLTSSVVTAEQNPYGGAQRNASGAEYGTRYANSVGEKLKQLLIKSVTYSFIVRRRGREILSLPVLIMIIIVCAMFYVSAVALLIGLLCECQYSVEKKEG